jgi:hypothetical protein
LILQELGASPLSLLRSVVVKLESGTSLYIHKNKNKNKNNDNVVKRLTITITTTIKEKLNPAEHMVFTRVKNVKL